MHSVRQIEMLCNKRFHVNFEGGDLSSDAGLLLIKEFIAKIGAEKLIQQFFKTNDTAVARTHTDDENIMQVIYQIMAAYFNDGCADELTNDPIMTNILAKKSLASQPTLSRFWNRMDQNTLQQLEVITQKIRAIVYAVQRPESVLLDIDSTLLPTYGNQEGEGFNYHYQQHGYHPLLCYDGITGDLLKAELRDGTQYCSNGAADFILPLIEEYSIKYPDIDLYLRGDSGFASPDLYEACEKGGCKYAIRLKLNKKLTELAEFETMNLTTALNKNKDWISYAKTYGEFWYQAGSWDKARRVVFKIEKPYNQMTFMYTFIVTNMEMEPYKVIKFYCGRGKMENFIKEGKNGFDFASVSSATKVVNANRLQVHGLAFNLFNWFRRLVLSAKMKHMRIDTIRLKLLKVAAKVVHSARYITFKLCSSCPYKNEFYETFDNIHNLAVQIE